MSTIQQVKSRAAIILPPIILIAALIYLWSWGVRSTVIPRWMLPAPEAIFAEFFKNTTMLMKHTRFTIIEALGGLGLGVAAGLIGALAMTMLPVVRTMLYPYALASRALPLVVFTPIIVILLGRGSVPIMIIVAISTYFPVFLGMMRGLAQTDAERMELLHSFSATPTQILWKIRFPSSLPFLFSALKVSASTAFINTVVTEWIASNAGLGYLVMVSGQYFKLATMWAAIFLVAVLTLALLALVALIEKAAGRYAALAAGG